MFKVYMKQGPEILQDVFLVNSQPEYNLRNKSQFEIQTIRTVHYGHNSFRYLGPKSWELIPSDMKDTESVEVFKNCIKNWILDNCPCRL